MTLAVRGTIPEISNMIDSFDHSYHGDFSLVRGIAKCYLSSGQEGLSPCRVSSLTVALRSVLLRWGAGKRKAPLVKSQGDIEQALCDHGLHDDLVYLASCLHSLGVDWAQGERLINGEHNEDELSSFDETLIRCLRQISSGIFIGNTNVTYPMKVLLLITGLLPALDSQVRKGLTNAGFSGVSSTQLLLTKALVQKKIVRLPFILGQCWKDHKEALESGVRNSRFPHLLTEPGRVFDVLLFKQETPSICLNLGLARQRWGDIK